jgi:hypothetical protein
VYPAEQSLPLVRAVRFPENSDAASCLGFNGTDLGCVQPDRAAGLNPNSDFRESNRRNITFLANEIAEIGFL